jgi:hypothetical protein
MNKNNYIITSTGKIYMSKLWFKSPKRRQYDRLIFEPSKRIDSCYKLSQGERRYYYSLPTLEVCREEFEKVYGDKIEWDSLFETEHNDTSASQLEECDSQIDIENNKTSVRPFQQEFTL